MTGSPASAHGPTSSSPPSAVRRRRLVSPRYCACLVILVVSAATMQIVAKALGNYFRKDPVPLKRPLAALDWDKLPDYQQHPVQSAPLDTEALQGLGTEEYLQVQLLDKRRAANDPVRVASVFITYYTGKPDMVPHVPDECFLAAGYDRVGAVETVAVPVPGVGAPNDEISVRALQFQRGRQERPVTVLYFFHVNDEYKTTRDQVRLRLATLFERYAYYAKIEVTFTDESSGAGQRVRYAGKEESVAAIGSLLQQLMPVLLHDHFGWERLMSGELARSES